MVVFHKTPHGEFVCTFLKCTPFSSCEFEVSMSSNVTELKAENETKAEKKLDHQLFDDFLGISESVQKKQSF